VKTTSSPLDTGSTEPARDEWTRSSAGERLLHTQDVASSILAASTTTFIGDVCEAIATARLLELGYGVSRPVSNGLPYDLIADDGRRLLRMQVKSASYREGALFTRMNSSKYHRGGRASVHYAGRVDWIVPVWRETGRCFAVRPEEAKQMVTLRIDPARNNQASGVRWAQDYELGVVLAGGA
jgi:hypothetical protein